jgi:hypothetical protein
MKSEVPSLAAIAQMAEGEQKAVIGISRGNDSSGLCVATRESFSPIGHRLAINGQQAVSRQTSLGPDVQRFARP